jgi:glycine/D-amino acid oxidase-like deaminating enzyme
LNVATTPRKLRSGRSVWEGRAARTVAIEPLTHDVTADVLIIGAGITGAAIADALAVAGVRVAVADKRGLAQGATLASTALVQYEIDTPLIALTRKIGKDKAGRAWRRSRLAVEALAARLSELKVPDVVRRDSLYLTGNVLDAAELRREHQARRAIGLSERFLDRATLRRNFGIARSAALQGYNNLVMDPRKSTFALLSAAAANGARIFRSPELTAVVPKRNGGNRHEFPRGA